MKNIINKISKEFTGYHLHEHSLELWKSNAIYLAEAIFGLVD